MTTGYGFGPYGSEPYGGDGFPVMLIEVAFSTLPSAAIAGAVWTDVSAYTKLVQTRRGRPNELSAIETGTCGVTLRNEDRRFDPLYTLSPYWPNVLPMRRLRVSATALGVTYRLFTGYVERWPQEWELSRYDTVQVEAVDGLEYLRQADVTVTAAPQEDSGTRVGRILDAAGWPAAERSIDTGRSQVQAGTYTGKALDLIEQCVQAELGRAYISGDGVFKYENRYRRSVPPYNVSAVTLGDSTGEIPYRQVSGSYDVVEIRNETRVTRVGGVEQVSSDATSQGKYLLRSYTSPSDLLLTDDLVAKSMADSLLQRYKDPLLRFGTIEINPLSDPVTIYPQILGRELGERVTVIRRPGLSTVASTIVRSGTTSLGSLVVTGLASTTDLRAGLAVTGTGIPASTQVAGVADATSLSLTNAATASGTVSLTFSEAIRIDQQIEQVEHTITPGVWQGTRYQLSPTATSTVWVLDDTLLGVLGVSTRLSF